MRKNKSMNLIKVGTEKTPPTLKDVKEEIQRLRGIRVFCENCVFSGYWLGVQGYTFLSCKHPANIVERFFPTHKTLEFVKGCDVLNSDNTCKLYKRKWWRFWIKGDC